MDALGKIGTKRAASALMTAAKDKDADVAAAAQAALPPILKKLKEQGQQQGGM